MEYVPIYSPADLSESAFIESLLKAGGIRYFIQGEVSTRMYPQLSLNQRVILVHPDDFRNAYMMLRGFIGGNPDEMPEFVSGEDEKLEPVADDSAKSETERFPLWLFILLAIYVVYKIATD